MLYYYKTITFSSKLRKFTVDFRQSTVEYTCGEKQTGIFDQSSWHMVLPATKAEFDAWNRFWDDVGRGGPVREMEEVIPCIDSPWGTYVTRYYFKPNRHQKKHSAIWKFCGK